MKTKQRIIALITTTLLLCANFFGVANAVIAADMPAQNNKTNHANVTFDSYLEGNVHSKAYKVEEGAKIYLKINVTNAGYLKNGVVNISNEANYTVDTEKLKSDMIESVTDNQIKLKQINSGSQVEIELPIKIKEANQVNKDFIEKTSAISLNATYVDGNGKEVSINKTINNQIIWEAQMSLELNNKVTKYIPFNEGEKYGVLVQTTISSKLKDHILPISKTELEIKVPEMEGILPEEVTVIANRTTNTNNDEIGINFTAENYEYNKEEKTLKIKVENVENSEGKIGNNKAGIDEYLVNYIYKGKELYDQMKEKTFTAESIVNAKITLSNTKASILEQANTIQYEEKEEKGNITDLELSTPNTLNKGKLYANYEKANQGKQANLETEYETKYSVKINNKQLNNNIEFLTGTESYKNAEEVETKVGTGSYIKQVIVPQDMFTKMLGQEGSIEINRVDGSNIAVINEEMATKENKEEENLQTNPDLTIENGNYVLNISERKLQEVQVKATSPVAEGTISVTLKKALNYNPKISLDEMKSFETLNIVAVNEMNQNAKEEITKTIELKEVTSKAQISVEDEQSLSTAIVNENVQIRATLDISSTENALYKNPTLSIKMPKQISKVEINKSSLLMDDGLKIKSIKQQKENGSIVIKVVLEGSQTNYAEGSEYKGTILLLDTNLTVDTLATSGSKKIEMAYTNENSVSQNKEEKAVTSVNIVAPTGIVAANGISNYAKKAKDIMTISANSVEAKLQTYSTKQIATITGKIVNNYGNKITNVQVLGRIPSKENTNTQTGESLGSTFNVSLNTPIKLTGIEGKNYKVYYSEKADATKDLKDVANAWTEQPTTSSKSYLIVTNNYEMEQGKQIDFEYNIEIPANLTYNNEASEMYQIYYDNVSKVGTIAETKISPIITTKTGAGPELKGEISQTVDTVREGQVVKMKVKVSNNGGTDATGVKVTVQKPENASLMQYSAFSPFITTNDETNEITIGTLKNGEIKEIYYYIKIDDNSSDTVGAVVNNISISANELEEAIPLTYTIENIKDGRISVNITASKLETEPIGIQEEMTYYVAVQNLKQEEALKNLVVTIPLPNGVSFNGGTAFKYEKDEKITYVDQAISYAEENNTVTVNLESLENLLYINITGTIENAQDTRLMATAEANGVDEHYSNLLELKAGKAVLQFLNFTSTPKYAKENTVITYTASITNIGNIDAKNVRLIDNLPNELFFQEASYTIDGDSNVYTISQDASNKTVEFNFSNINVGSKVNITIKALTIIFENEQEKEIKNKLTISADNVAEMSSDTITNIVEYSQKIHDVIEGNENPGEGSSQNNIISGTAWLDENKNGIREENERLLSNIQVALLNSTNNTIIKDSNTGKDKVVVTDENGKYTITNVQNGSYIVVFVYDSSNYGITSYQAEQVDQSLNSDAIEMNITLNGEKRLAGITDVITINGNNARDIDIGLYKLQRFDLRLEKYISKITLTTPTIGTKVYTNKNSKIEKVEILGRNAGKASMVIEYKLVVKNEGAVAGYVKKLVDYLPQSVSFSTDLNKDWYLSENGNVYNASLANTLIEPGESKEVTLIVSKKITEEDMGNILNNNAEIYESDNEQGLKDIDSVAGNNQAEEDDISKADIIISTVTGTIIKYTSLGVAIVVILVIGIYEIKKHVLKQERR